MRIRDLPNEAKPREKALQFGIECLSDAELLAIIIGSGVRNYSALEIANNLLKDHYTLKNISNTNLETLSKYKGLKKVGSLKLLATFEFYKRLISPLYQSSEQLLDAKQVYSRYKYLESYSQEVLLIIMLDRKRNILKEKMMYVGTSENFDIDAKEIISEILISKCSKFILIHNHPDGDIIPSEEDIFVTSYIGQRAQDFKIKLIDHIIIGKNDYYSLSENRTLWFDSSKILYKNIL